MELPKQNENQLYSTNSELNVVFVERFNRTLLDTIKEPMYIESKACWLNQLDAALEKYNNRVHGTTKMTLFEMVTNPNKPIHNPILIDKIKLPIFQVGDSVRVPDKRNLYSRGYTTNWNRELFEIHKINKTNPVTYGLVDGNNELIEGNYYEQELLRSVFNFKSNNKTLESMNNFHQFE